jgi:hypothetical protein
MKSIHNKTREVLGTRVKMPRLDKSTPAQDFYEGIVNNPEEIIAWAKCEIKEYQKLIKIINENTKNSSSRL